MNRRNVQKYWICFEKISHGVVNSKHSRTVVDRPIDIKQNDYYLNNDLYTHLIVITTTNNRNMIKIKTKSFVKRILFPDFRGLVYAEKAITRSARSNLIKT